MRSPYKSIKHSTYFPVYDRLFGRFVGKKVTFVETKLHEEAIYSVQFFESFVVFEFLRDLCANKSEITDNGGETKKCRRL